MPDIDFSEHFVMRILRRLRPQYGWLPFILLCGVLAFMVLSLLEVRWTESDRLIIPVVVVGFALSAILAQRPMRTVLVWTILLVVGLGVILGLTADLWPPLDVVSGSREAFIAHERQALALYSDRVSGWYRTVSRGGSSTDTIVFTSALAVAGWLLAAFLAWSAYRLDKPYLGLTTAGIALALNTYYGRAGIYWVIVFVGVAVTAATYLSYLYRERDWERASIDYSLEVRAELLLYATGVSIGLMALAIALPTVNIRATAEAFQRQEAVVEAEQTLSRAFAGLQQPHDDETALRSASVMPRGFLLDMAPDLLDTVVMRATYRPAEGQALTPEMTAALSRLHWRSFSFDIYTGRGWLRSPEQEELIPARQPIGSASGAGDHRLELEQRVEWLLDNRAIRYTLGQPALFSHDVAAVWRGTDDLVGVFGRNVAPPRYAATTHVASADPDVLNQARIEDVPPQILARYTSLPPEMPGRVRELARQIVGQAPASSTEGTVVPEAGGAVPLTPYQQALALEAFLHQYPYSLEVTMPPEETDMVDYFLFDLQQGFCDYYASAMVVMARSIGLPARLAVGFLQQPPGEDGVQVIHQRNAHSWAEVYFAGVGWVEFEPTSSLQAEAAAGPDISDELAPIVSLTPQAVSPVSIPPRDAGTSQSWPFIVGFVATAVVAWLLWRWRALAEWRSPLVKPDIVQSAFGRLQRSAKSLGYPAQVGQTPDEFASGLAGHLTTSVAATEPDLDTVTSRIRRLTLLFARRQYGSTKTTAASDQEAQLIGYELRRPLRRMVWRQRLRHHEDEAAVIVGHERVIEQ